MGAGAFGSAIAQRVAEDGGEVVVVDPASASGSASAIAAGMLAPAFEAILDDKSQSAFALLRTARNLWASLAARLGGEIGLRLSGALWIDLPGARPQLEAQASALAGIGAACEVCDAAALSSRIPGLAWDGLGAALFTSEDWRLDPPLALVTLKRAAQSLGAAFVRDEVVGFEHGRVALLGGGVLAADVLIWAAGFARTDIAPETNMLAPIKGQLVQFNQFSTSSEAPAVRTASGYAASGLGGLRVGATMELGRDDRKIDSKAVEPFADLAGRLFPALVGEPFEARAGVRAATPDGLPLVGPSSNPGVLLATGARRNGWLLAPLVAEMTAAYLAGRDPGPFGDLLAPSRSLEGEGVCPASG